MTWTAYRRLILVPEGALVLTSEAVWGMVAFATVAMAMASGGIRAAWEARNPPTEPPWREVDLDEIRAP